MAACPWPLNLFFFPSKTTGEHDGYDFRVIVEFVDESLK